MNAINPSTLPQGITGGSPQDVQSFFGKINLQSSLEDIRASEKNKPEDHKRKVQKQQEHGAIEAGLGKGGTPAGGSDAVGSVAPAAMSISLA